MEHCDVCSSFFRVPEYDPICTLCGNIVCDKCEILFENTRHRHGVGDWTWSHDDEFPNRICVVCAIKCTACNAIAPMFLSCRTCAACVCYPATTTCSCTVQVDKSEPNCVLINIGGGGQEFQYGLCATCIET
jgi:hypothetical protein